MKSFLRLLPIASLVVTAAAIGGEQEVLKFRLDNGTDPVEVVLDSQQTGFRVQQLVPGESRSLVTGAGQNVTVTRLEEGLSLDVDGQTFEVPAVHQPPAGHSHEIETLAGTGLTIFSDKALDDQRKQTISAALAAAGITDEIRFISAAGDEGTDTEIIIEKEIVDSDGAQKRIITKKRVD